MGLAANISVLYGVLPGLPGRRFVIVISACLVIIPVDSGV